MSVVFGISPAVGAEVILIDSSSHAWGKDGALEMVAKDFVSRTTSIYSSALISFSGEA
jgi:hypothetical protein